MKTVTMDWETYQAEIQASKDAVDDAYEKGAIENNRRLHPIVEQCRVLVKSDPDAYSSLLKLLEDAGEI